MFNHRQFGQMTRALTWSDLVILAALLAVIGGVVLVAREWTGPLRPLAEIHLEPRYLPQYALFSLARGALAYAISFLFTMVYGYMMARLAGAERVMLPALDILQSIPVLGFLPGFVLALLHLFPHSNVGLELASVLMIFTGQVWNMTFSFYSSLKSVPPDLVAVTRLARLPWAQRFIGLDLSFAANGLVWNSMMSVAGGWFFLTVSEAFTLGDHDFRLPGLGSYVSLAIERGDRSAQVLGLLAMLVMIAAVDQLVWRPIVGWAQKFTEDERNDSPKSWLWEWLRRSRIWREGSNSANLFRRGGRVSRTQRLSRSSRETGGAPPWGRALKRTVLAVAGLGVLCGVAAYVHLLAGLTATDWRHLLASAAATFLRVILAVSLASCWTIPAGVWLGRNPRWARWIQPAVQMAASFPAPMIFPLVVGAMLWLGAGLSFSSVILLGVGTQWYILFNVIAGSKAIPRELWEVSQMAGFSRWQRWRTLIFPAIFPHLLTGWITAMGGAWNASVVAEFLKYQGRTLSTTGLGAAINQATAHGNFPLLAAAVGMMAVAVVGFNRLVWRPLSHHAQTRFNLSTAA
jgi:NitT/TauT family transport system permease protein